MESQPDLHAIVADTAPTGEDLTPYDRQHLLTYLRLLDADAEGANWQEVARVVLKRDLRHNPETSVCFFTHLTRARWMVSNGYGRLLHATD